jgi:NAD(P)H-dependent flavin oxidoreductase YrpB (nitropropane dioxygenase family)
MTVRDLSRSYQETVMPSPDLFHRLGISHPIFQAPIGGIASAELAAAVAEAGGVGIWPVPGAVRTSFVSCSRRCGR